MSISKAVKTRKTVDDENAIGTSRIETIADKPQIRNCADVNIYLTDHKCGSAESATSAATGRRRSPTGLGEASRYVNAQKCKSPRRKWPELGNRVIRCGGTARQVLGGGRRGAGRGATADSAPDRFRVIDIDDRRSISTIRGSGRLGGAEPAAATAHGGRFRERGRDRGESGAGFTCLGKSAGAAVSTATRRNGGAGAQGRRAAWASRAPKNETDDAAPLGTHTDTHATHTHDTTVRF